MRWLAPIWTRPADASKLQCIVMRMHVVCSMSQSGSYLACSSSRCAGLHVDPFKFNCTAPAKSVHNFVRGLPIAGLGDLGRF
jgi:hypothetical protein